MSNNHNQSHNQNRNPRQRDGLIPRELQVLGYTLLLAQCLFGLCGHLDLLPTNTRFEMTADMRLFADWLWIALLSLACLFFQVAEQYFGISD